MGTGTSLNLYVSKHSCKQVFVGKKQQELQESGGVKVTYHVVSRRRKLEGFEIRCFQFINRNRPQQHLLVQDKATVSLLVEVGKKRIRSLEPRRSLAWSHDERRRVTQNQPFVALASPEHLLRSGSWVDATYKKSTAQVVALSCIVLVGLQTPTGFINFVKLHKFLP